eukprot:9189006-Pyramimonas_sp.AAC.1
MAACRLCGVSCIAADGLLPARRLRSIRPEVANCHHVWENECDYRAAPATTAKLLHTGPRHERNCSVVREIS